MRKQNENKLAYIKTTQLSNPFSSGGGGSHFENRVQTTFVVLMLTGGFAPCLPPWPIHKIKLQGKYKNYDTDDVRSLLRQAKHAKDASDFIERINLTKFTSDKQKNKLNVFQYHLKNANSGTQTDGSFSGDHFNKWLASIKKACSESGHLEVALSQVGNVLIHCPPDPNGLWISNSVANALNAKDAEDLRRGFSRGMFNSHGVHRIDREGKPEKELATKYRQQAEEVEAHGYQRLASTLRELADSYEREAERIIDEHMR